MNKDDIVAQVIGAVNAVQEQSGRAVVGLGPGTRPFKDVEGFDSLSGVEATVLLSSSLGHELPDSVFLPAEGNRVLSVNEIAENVGQYINARSAAA